MGSLSRLSVICGLRFFAQFGDARMEGFASEAIDWKWSDHANSRGRHAAIIRKSELDAFSHILRGGAAWATLFCVWVQMSLVNHGKKNVHWSPASVLIGEIDDRLFYL